MSERTGKPFEIGLVMAGAVSGGAYTSGVLDFLIEATDAWYDAMKKDAKRNTVPRHEVLLKAMSGASAGSLATAIVATALRYQFLPVRLKPGDAAPQNTGNPLYEAWVRSVDIADLLDVADLEQKIDGEPSHRLISVLNSRKIDQTVQSVLNATGAPKPREWVASNLPVSLTVGNLRGVPYGIPLHGAGTIAHPMMRHGDHVSFAIGGAGTGPVCPVGPDFLTLNRPNSALAWRALGDAAMASGAFPFMLRPRLLERSPQDYDRRTYLEAGDGQPTLSAYKPILPDWARPQATAYRFLCMDGGIMNNEPLELARTLLTNGRFERNPRDGDKAHRAVVMLDPFLDPHEFGPDDEKPLHHLLMPLFNAWKGQCRFKPEDLALANDDITYSRFLIAPRRDYGPTGNSHALAAGGFGAFLGFFSESFRRHDYQLGRRNCQKFLRAHFTLPKENALFDAWDPAVKAEWLKKPEYADGELPIVPLIGDCCSIKETHLEWPVGACDPERLKEPIEQRLSMVFNAFKDDMNLGFWRRLWVNANWSVVKGSLVAKIMAALEAALKRQSL